MLWLWVLAAQPSLTPQLSMELRALTPVSAAWLQKVVVVVVAQELPFHQRHRMVVQVVVTPMANPVAVWPMPMPQQAVFPGQPTLEVLTVLVNI